MKMQLIDIGGSGIKSVQLPLYGDPNLSESTMTHYETPNWGNFVPWLAENGLLDCEHIGISCAGFINSNGLIKLCRIAGWENVNLVNDIKAYAPDAHVYLLNDAEAHLMAHHDLVANPMITLSLGTSVGFAINDHHNRIIRPADGFNFDIGAISIPTKASCKQLWWALGSGGLSELTKNMGEREGIRQYGYRLGAYLVSLCSIFRPKSIVLSGGIIKNCGHLLYHPVCDEFAANKPDWLEPVSIQLSPYRAEAALMGMAKYIQCLL